MPRPVPLTPAAFRRLALSLPGAEEAPHFARTSFRVGGRIFATMTPAGDEAMVPVRPPARALGMLRDAPDVFVDHGGWTRRLGSLGVRLARADGALVEALLREAHARVAAKARGAPAAGGRATATSRRPRRGPRRR
ncbi:MAG: MmcQ/YjbR family DNA-binding protein [Planctomycetes bacterium]|nr:MmcQ/YjbR family DNA-binding protein [Planctomycetota bacterium]